jgi:uncharacterized protein
MRRLRRHPNATASATALTSNIRLELHQSSRLTVYYWATTALKSLHRRLRPGPGQQQGEWGLRSINRVACTGNSGRRALLAGLMLIGGLSNSALPQSPTAENASAAAVHDPLRADPDFVVYRDVMVPMRDGVRLATDVYLPSRNGFADPTARFPIVLIRTPYDKLLPDTPVGSASYLTKHGYAVVIQDVRGTNRSEGVFEPMVNESWGVKQDGADTIAWLVRQRWSDGKVGTTGISYLGGVQLLVASMNVPGLITEMVEAPAVNQFGKGWVYNGDMLDLGANADWVVAMAPTVAAKAPREIHDAIVADEKATGGPFSWKDSEKIWALLKGGSLRDLPIARYVPFWRQWLDHRDDPAFFANSDAAARFAKVTIPLFHWVGWYDLFQRNSIDAYEGITAHGATLAARQGQRLLVGPWSHGLCDECRQFPDARLDDSAATGAWMDFQMRAKPNPIFDHPVILYVMGANRWRAEDAWPPTGSVPTRYYFHSDGRANGSTGGGALTAIKPSGSEGPDSYIYDPEKPLPSLAGHSLFGGSRDQQANERRADVLVYATPPLTEDVEVTGHVRATLYAASSATDTDWHLKLVDVFPDGRAFNVANGAVRARYRLSRTKPTPLSPGKVEVYELDLWSTSNVFEKGHRIRVEIASSDFPNTDLNPNKFIDLSTATAKDYVVAHQTVFHDASRPSSIELPIIPAKRSRNWIPTPFATGPEGRFFLREEAMPEAQPKVIDAAMLPQN